MTKRIMFRHMDHSQPMQEHADKHLAKIERFLEHEPSPVHIDLVMEPSKTREHHRIELIVKSPSYDLVVHHEYTGENFYAALDKIIDTMYYQLHEHKRKKIEVERHQAQEFKKETRSE